jgi:hypothetical protein
MGHLRGAQASVTNISGNNSGDLQGRNRFRPGRFGKPCDIRDLMDSSFSVTAARPALLMLWREKNTQKQALASDHGAQPCSIHNVKERTQSYHNGLTAASVL